MKLTSESFSDGAPIPGDYAFCIPAKEGHVCLGRNLNPHLAWSDLPVGTQSLVLLCHDPDVPSKPDDVNQEGRGVPADLPRIDFFHWVLIDLPPTLQAIAAGSHSAEVLPGGQAGGATPDGGRQGLNDFTAWFEGDASMGGEYHGYDGPCPPWNDSIRHRYIFTLYALDVKRLPLDEPFTGADVRQAIDGHILAQASLTGTYSLNPEVAA